MFAPSIPTTGMAKVISLFDQHPQDAALGLARHVGHFVEVEGAAMGAFKHADLARLAALAFLAEQLQIHAFRSHAGGADRDELALGTGRMDHAGDHFLARSRWPRDQHAAVGGGDLGDQIDELLGVSKTLALSTEHNFLRLVRAASKALRPMRSTSKRLYSATS